MGVNVGVNVGVEEPIQVRVLVADIAGSGLEWIVESIKMQEGMIPAGQVKDRVELLTGIATAVDEGKAIEALVLSAPHVSPPPGICSRLLAEFPHLKIMVASPANRKVAHAGPVVKEASRPRRAVRGALVYWMGLRQSRPSAAVSITPAAIIHEIVTWNLGSPDPKISTIAAIPRKRWTKRPMQ